MFLELDGLLTPAEVAQVIALAGQMNFIDGKTSNPANTTKENMRADFTDPRNAEATALLANALARSGPFMDFCMPKKVAPPSMLRYDAGMKYGAHSDAALMTVGGPPMRSDLSCTIFLSEPSNYQGGELVIHLGTRPVVIKGRRVGWLARVDAARYHNLVAGTRSRMGDATCIARIRGGWDRGAGDVGQFGVVLRLPEPGASVSG